MQALLQLLTKSLNTLLNLDPESKKRLQSLQGHAITIELLPFHFVFQCLFSADGVNLQALELFQADTKLIGTPLQFAGMMFAKTERQRFFSDDLIITGDAELGQRVVALFDELTIDWQENLSRVIGDVPTYHLNRTLNHGKNWLQHVSDTFANNLNE